MLPSRSQVEAERVRADLGLASGYVDVFDVARRLGAEIYFHPFGDDNVEGAYKLVEGLAFILINADRPLVRRRYTMGHEIGHLRLGGNDAGVVESARTMNGPDPEERNANRFAAYLLMDADGVANLVADIADSLAKIVAVATTYVVSPPAATIHLCDLGLISPADKDAFLQSASSRATKAQMTLLGYTAPRDTRPVGINRIDVRHLDDALTAYEAGQYSVSALAADFDMTTDEVQALLRRRGIREPVVATPDLNLSGFDIDG